MKALAWMMRMVIAAVLLSGCSMYATWITVQSYLDKVLAQYGIKEPAQKAQFSEFLSQMAGGLNILNQQTSSSDGHTVLGLSMDKPGSAASPQKSEPDQKSGAGTQAESSSAGTADASREGGGKKAGDRTSDPQEESLPVWNQNGQQQKNQLPSQIKGSTNEAGRTEQSSKMVVTTEQLQHAKDQLSTDDKLKMFSLLSKLPEKELQAISQLVEDGITTDELHQMEGIVESYLSPEEYKQVLEILDKYK